MLMTVIDDIFKTKSAVMDLTLHKLGRKIKFVLTFFAQSKRIGQNQNL